MTVIVLCSLIGAAVGAAAYVVASRYLDRREPEYPKGWADPDSNPMNDIAAAMLGFDPLTESERPRSPVAPDPHPLTEADLRAFMEKTQRGRDLTRAAVATPMPE